MWFLRFVDIFKNHKQQKNRKVYFGRKDKTHKIGR